jgi:ParB family chromosome partitioning protein
VLPVAGYNGNRQFFSSNCFLQPEQLPFSRSFQCQKQMPTQFSYKNIPFTALHDSFTWNLHPFLNGLIPDTLEKSIVKVGILHPPIVVQTGADTYDIICGRKRIQCGKRLGQSHFLCHILPSASPKKTLLSFLLEDQISGSPLSFPEMAYYLKLCLDHLKGDETSEILTSDLLPKMSRMYLLSLLEFDHAILRRIHYGQLAEKILYDLLQLNQEDRTGIVGLIELLQLGEGKQKRLITLCRDIVLRENISIGALLNQPEIKAIIEHKEMNVPQKTNRLLGLLQKCCYPQSTAAKESFESQLHSLALPQTCDIRPSPSFEKDEVTLSLRFPDFEACKLILPVIRDFLGQKR